MCGYALRMSMGLGNARRMRSNLDRWSGGGCCFWFSFSPILFHRAYIGKTNGSIAPSVDSGCARAAIRLRAKPIARDAFIVRANGARCA